MRADEENYVILPVRVRCQADTPPTVCSPTSAGNLVLDDDLTPAERASLSQFTTPRLTLDGRAIWLLDEVAAEAADA